MYKINTSDLKFYNNGVIKDCFVFKLSEIKSTTASNVKYRAYLTKFMYLLTFTKHHSETFYLYQKIKCTSF